MHWFQFLALLSLAVCISCTLYHLIRLIRLGKPLDYAPSSGKTLPAIQYSFTGAMSPLKKESAFLHLPTYTAGILYHLGTFLSILLFFLFLVQMTILASLAYFFSGFLLITTVCGTGILIKRLAKKELRSLSSPDDYFSNLLVTLFQLLTSLLFFFPSVLPFYYILTSILLLYFPIGKLKHAIYFFAARYHLGLFYGRRGVWPPKNLS